MRALLYAALLWVIGFVWGSVVFMAPALKAVAPIPHVSGNPAISFPILVIWAVVAWWLARKFLKAGPDRPAMGLKLGHFRTLTPWVAYLLLFLIPLWVGRSAR